MARFFLIFLLLFGFSSESPKLIELSSNPCKIILLRHGETDWNIVGKSQGWTDIPLNEQGKAQAKELSKEFSQLMIKTIYSSSLSRAIETAQIIAEPHKASIISDPALRFYDRNKKKHYLLSSPKAKLAQIEQEIRTDAFIYLKNIAKNHPGETILVVTHQAVITSFWRNIGKHKKKIKKLANGQVIYILSTENSLVII